MSRDPEQLGHHQDALALASMTLRNSEEILAYRADGGVDVMRFIETGETSLKTFGVDDTGETLAFEYKVREPLFDTSFATLHDYVTSLGTDYSKPRDKVEIWRGHAEQDPALEEARTAILVMAKELAPDLEDIDRTEACFAECHAGSRTYDCFCTFTGGSSYTDIDGNTVKQREVGVADPECNTCEGAGHYDGSCAACLGSGETIVNPIVIIINNTTGQEESFRLEIAELLSSGAIELKLRPNPHQYYNVTVKPPVPRPPQISASMNIAPYIQKRAAAVGIDIENDEYYTYWGDQPLDTWGTTFGHMLRQMDGIVTAPSEYESLQSFADFAMAELQKNLAQQLRTDPYGLDRATATPEEIIAHAKTFDLTMNDDFTIKQVGLRLDKPSSPDEALQELISTLDLYGYRLGLAYTGIATGETGPALYILDRAGNLQVELSAGYDTTIILENARNYIRKAHENGEITHANNQ